MKRGFIIITSTNRFEELRKMLTSLRKFHKEPVMLLLADNREQAHFYKCKACQLSPFDITIQLDSDMLINGSLDYLFSLAERGNIGVFIPLFLKNDIKRLNSGVIVYPTNLFVPISQEWEKAFLQCKNRIHYSMDQGHLGNILFNHFLGKYVEIIPEEYNFCIQEYFLGGSKLDEVKDFAKVKIFHFFTSHTYPPFNKPVKCFETSKAWKEFNKL